jgi:hypothetical protein
LCSEKIKIKRRKKIKMKKVIKAVKILVVCVSLVSVVLFAGDQNVGTTSCMFKVFLSPKVVSLGGAYSTFTDADSLSINPAGVSLVVSKEASFGYTKWLVDTSYGYLSFVFPTKIGGFGILVNYFTAGDMDEYDTSGNPTNKTFTANGILIFFSLLKEIKRKNFCWYCG